jgi:Domain of unknown function (DUF4136)
MEIRVALACLAALLLDRGALAQKVTVEFDQAADFSKYKTFAIRDGQADIARLLTAKGLVEVAGKSDLNVRYALGSARKTELEAYPAGWYGWGTRYVRVPYAEGTLVIDLRDPTTRSLVWRGIAAEDSRDPAKIEGKLDDMVKKPLEKYPPKPK